MQIWGVDPFFQATDGQIFYEPKKWRGFQKKIKDLASFGAHIAKTHLLSATVRLYSLVAPCRLPDLTSLALLGSVSGQRGLSRGPLPGYKTVSKWRLQLQDSIPFLLLSQRLCTTLHTSASLGCYLLFTHMPDCPLAPLGQVWQQ